MRITFKLRKFGRFAFLFLLRYLTHCFLWTRWTWRLTARLWTVQTSPFLYRLHHHHACPGAPWDPPSCSTATPPSSPTIETASAAPPVWALSPPCRLPSSPSHTSCDQLTLVTASAVMVSWSTILRLATVLQDKQSSRFSLIIYTQHLPLGTLAEQLMLC